MRRIVVSHECCMSICINVLISNFVAENIGNIGRAVFNLFLFICSFNVIFSSIFFETYIYDLTYVTYVKEIHLNLYRLNIWNDENVFFFSKNNVLNLILTCLFFLVEKIASSINFL